MKQALAWMPSVAALLLIATLCGEIAVYAGLVVRHRAEWSLQDVLRGSYCGQPK